MMPRSLAAFFLVFFLCILIGALVGVRELREDRVTARLAEKYLGVRDIGNYRELSSVLPEKLAVFVYSADRKLAIFGALAGLGTVLAWLAIRLLARMSREEAKGAIPVESRSSLREVVADAVQRSPGILVKIAATLAGTTIVIGLCVYWLGITWFAIPK